MLGKTRAFRQAASEENALFLGPPLHPPGHLKMLISESLLDVLFVWVCGILFFSFFFSVLRCPWFRPSHQR